MSEVRPFRALRPDPEKAARVSSVPYDVIYESEVREVIAAEPLSFLRVSRPEAEFRPGDNPSTVEILGRARHNLQRMIDDRVLFAESEPAYYIYRLEMDGQTQTGIIGCCSIDEYESGDIKRHEFTRPDKVEDRTNHIIALRAQTGLIFLAFRGTERLRKLVAEATGDEPLYDFTCELGVRHTLWRSEAVSEFASAFAEVPAIYVADGHHRLESARVTRDKLRAENPSHNGSEEYNFVVACMFPAEDLRIMAYNRVVKDVGGLTKDQIFTRLGESFLVTKTSEKEPKSHGEICMYTGGRWYKLVFNVQYFRQPDPIDRLDVSILQQWVLEPIFGIKDPRTDDRVGFVGGRRGTSELERMVDSGEAKLAFSMFPTTMDDLFAVSDAGEIMPPKSTWFEPKLRDGLVIHQI